jgi:hypothetical protein
VNPTKLAAAARYYRQHGRFEQAHFYETILLEQGRCKRCGARLTDPESIERGIGPDCAKKETR